MTHRHEALALAAVVAIAACTDNTTAPVTGFYATLSADQEPTSTGSPATAAASFTVTGPPTGGVGVPGDSVKYTLAVSGSLSSNWTMAHIHSGLPGGNGPVQVNLCGTGAPAPACPTSGTLSISGTATVKTGGISFDSIYALMKTGAAYVNIHTTSNPGGEIRGTVLINPLP